MSSLVTEESPTTPTNSTLLEYLNIPYHHNSSSESYHSFDLYVPQHPQSSKPLPPLICFVHGGAWRSEDKADHAILARRLASASSFPVAVPNYRLTRPNSPLLHPAHAEDILAFLNFILAWSDPASISDSTGTHSLHLASPCYDPSKLFLMGHSCSAHMLTSIFLQPSSSQEPCPSLTPSIQLISSVKAIIISEGIYDIDLLLKSFPSYKEWFIADTFTDLPSYSHFNTAEYDLPKDADHIKWFVVHSTGDTLVDIIQSEVITKHLEAIIDQSQGKCIDHDFITLKAEHNTILKEEYYPKMVVKFITAVLAQPTSL